MPKFISILLLTVITGLSSRPHLQAQTNDSRKDSLHTILKNIKEPSEKLPVLLELSRSYWQQPEEATLLKELIDLSVQLDTLNYIGESYSRLCRYYYNESQLDSLIYWKNQLDSIYRRHAITPPAFFQTRLLLCKYYQGILNYELAISEAFKLLNDAKKAQDDYGLMLANQCIGFAYQGMGRNKEATTAYKEGLIYLKKLNPNPVYEIQYVSEIIPSFLDENLLNESLQLINRYKELYQIVYKIYADKGVSYQSIWHKWLFNSYYAELYMKKGQLDKAGKYIKEADKYIDQSTEENMKYPYYRIKALYCYKNKDYTNALKAINRGLDIEVQPHYLKLKIDILTADGQKAKAIATYEELFALNSRMKKEAFERQIQQLRLLNDLNDQERQTYELQRQNDQLALRTQWVRMGLGISLLLLILLFIRIRYYLRSNKLKNALECEKEALVKSEKESRLAKEKAEEANRQKTDFIAKISHEIRTPSNAIVGFSKLLSEDEDSFSDEEKKEFTDLIKENSKLLMNIVNNILDLALVDAGRFSLNIKAYDVIACCREVISEINSLMQPNVRLVFEPPVEKYMLNTDRNRFMQVLRNLLENAAKFTREGEINLTFEEEEHLIRVSVTDTGCGISPEKQSHIFHRFEKVNEFVQGVGLGLAISSHISEQFKGSLFIDSAYTTGARFIFTHSTELINNKQS